MNGKSPKNLAASVHQKLLNKARTDLRPFNELLQYYAMERFLSRLSRSSHKNKFILKRALVLWGWQEQDNRPTRDIDLLGITSNDINSVSRIFTEICRTETGPDGLFFDADTIEGARITEDSDYQGLRIKFQGYLDRAQIPMQIDIGFGDIVHPHPEVINFPSLLEHEIFQLQSYSKESFIAEKFQVMVKLGQINSRIKDFYDIWLLSRQYNFSGNTLCKAIKVTFNNRKTPFPEKVKAFDPEFISERARQWKSFANRFGAINMPQDFSELIKHISTFLSPVNVSLSKNQELNMEWIAPGPWQDFSHS